jgi:hypothetical protein
MSLERSSGACSSSSFHGVTIPEPRREEVADKLGARRGGGRRFAPEAMKRTVLVDGGCGEKEVPGLGESQLARNGKLRTVMYSKSLEHVIVLRLWHRREIESLTRNVKSPHVC